MQLRGKTGENTKREKRKCERKKVDQASPSLYVEIPLSVPRGVTIRKEILDISEKGLSFLMPEEEGVFMVNTPLVNIDVLQEGFISHIPWARVVYNKKIYGEGINYRVGLEFEKEGVYPTKRPEHGQTEYSRFRLPRYDGELLGDADRLVCLKDRAGRHKSYEMVNFSKYGVAFRAGGDYFEELGIFRVGEILENLRIIIDFRTAYEGRGSIVSFREQDDALIIGVQLEGPCLDVDKLFYYGKRATIKNEIKKFLTELPLGDKISGEFKTIVADMRYYLDALTAKLEKESLRLATEDSVMGQKIMKDVFRTVLPIFSNFMNSCIDKLNEPVNSFDKEEFGRHKAYFQEQLHYLLLQSPFIRRCVEKPFGYSGDYVTINMLLDNAWDGTTSVGKLLTKHLYQTDPGIAIRLRKDFIRNEIEQKCGQDRKDVPRVLSIGCGACRELKELLRVNDRVKGEFYLLDFDERPLFFAERALSGCAHLPHIRIHYLNKSIRSLIRARDIEDNRYDLVYSLGLIDYLSDHTCKILIEAMMARLKPGGTLIIGQYHEGNPIKAYMEFGLEWHLIYRDVEHLTTLIDRSKSDALVTNVIVENTYSCLTLTKKADSKSHCYARP